jgi:hypothetical protein
MVKKIRGITIGTRTEPVRPVEIDLSGPEGKQAVLAAARRVWLTAQ